MNIQPGNRKNTRLHQARNVKHDTNWGVRLFNMFKMLIIVAMVAGIFQTYVTMKQRIDHSTRNILNARIQIENVKHELTNLRNKHAKYSSFAFVSKQITRFRLPLQPAEPGQRCRIVCLTPEQAARFDIPRQRRRELASNSERNQNNLQRKR